MGVKFKMKKNKLIISVVILGVIMLILLIYLLLLSFSHEVSEEKCSSLDTDDCWHSLAHQTLNSTYCNKIKNNEIKEHCFEHIPR